MYKIKALKIWTIEKRNAMRTFVERIKNHPLLLLFPGSWQRTGKYAYVCVSIINRKNLP